MKDEVSFLKELDFVIDTVCSQLTKCKVFGENYTLYIKELLKFEPLIIEMFNNYFVKNSKELINRLTKITILLKELCDWTLINKIKST